MSTVATNVTGAGLENLQGMTKLRHLNVGFLKITDAGLMHLMGLTKFTELAVNDTQVTDEGVAKFQKAFPKCSIIRVILGGF